MTTPDMTCVLSGQKALQKRLLQTLTAEGFELADEQHSYGMSDDPQLSWIVCHTTDLTLLASVAEKSRYQLRMYWNTPDCQVCNGSLFTSRGADCTHCKGKGVSNKPASSPEQEILSLLEKLSKRLTEVEKRLPG